MRRSKRRTQNCEKVSNLRSMRIIFYKEDRPRRRGDSRRGGFNVRREHGSWLALRHKWLDGEVTEVSYTAPKAQTFEDWDEDGAAILLIINSVSRWALGDWMNAGGVFKDDRTLAGSGDSVEVARLVATGRARCRQRIAPLSCRGVTIRRSRRLI